MAPIPVEDYYAVLQVEQTCAPELISKAYKRLAKELHPDRNSRPDATQAFQQLQRAYETLSDKTKRQAYDLNCSSIKQSCPSTPTAQTSRSPHASTSQPDTRTETAQIAVLHLSKQERGARWRPKKMAFDSSIFALQRAIRIFEQEISKLTSFEVSDAAEDARMNSWGTWLLSPIYKKPEDSEEEKNCKDRAKQERQIQKHMKERFLQSRKADLEKEKILFKLAKEEIDRADSEDDMKMRTIEAKMRTREQREAQVKARVEEERRERLQKEQQKRWEAAEVLKKKQAEERAAAQRRQQAEEQAAARKRQHERDRQRQKIIDDERRRNRERSAYSSRFEGSGHQTHTSSCQHDVWWPKVQGRTACPDCSEIWTYLLQCPRCARRACPRCQSVIRPRVTRGTARTSRGHTSRIRSRSPEYINDWYD